MSEVESRIGVSSFTFYNMSIYEIAKLLGKNNLGLEIHLNDFDAEIGNPKPLTQGGVWPRTFGKGKREELKEAIKELPIVTVHGTPFDLNISANNPGIREESIKQYEEAMDFAYDIGSKTVTYHPGGYSSQIMPYSVYLERHIDFAKRIIKRAEKYGIRTGLENGNNISFFLKIIEEVNSPNWGHLLDIGHAIMGVKGDTRTVLNWIDKLGVENIVEIHAHNVLAWSAVGGGMIDHFPFEDGTCLEIKPIFRRLKEIGYQGPIIFEIVQNTAQKVIDACLRAKEIICEIWEK